MSGMIYDPETGMPFDKSEPRDVLQRIGAAPPYDPTEDRRVIYDGMPPKGYGMTKAQLRARLADRAHENMKGTER
jgi:hypothetical protein